jgi:hypothetical protein
MNISAGTVDMSGAKFTLGITFTFPSGYLIPAGQRRYLVENTVTFDTVFPGTSAQVAGQYAGNLSNGGEQLIFLTAANAVIKDFIYDDIAPWPTEPDGTGPALVLIRPETNPAHGVAANWRASTTNGGAPGQPDSFRYAYWNTQTNAADGAGNLDTDGDGLANLLEYALGTVPTTHNGHGITHGTATFSGQPHMTFSLTRPMGRDDILFEVECSTSLVGNWTPAVLVSRVPNYLTGQLSEVWRYPDSSTGATRQFMRAKATAQ